MKLEANKYLNNSQNCQNETQETTNGITAEM